MAVCHHRRGVRRQLLGSLSLEEAEVLDRVAHSASQQLVDRALHRLADGIPQRHLEPGEHEGAEAPGAARTVGGEMGLVQ